MQQKSHIHKNKISVQLKFHTQTYRRRSVGGAGAVPAGGWQLAKFAGKFMTKNI
jgi:hypothetical protein